VKTSPAKIRLAEDGANPWYEVILIEGRNRQIRRMFSERGISGGENQARATGAVGIGRGSGEISCADGAGSGEIEEPLREGS